MGTARGEAAAASSGLELVAVGEAGRVDVGDAVPVREDEPVGVDGREVVAAPVVAVAGTSGCVVAAVGRPVGVDGDADLVAVDRGAVAASRVVAEPGTRPGVDEPAARGGVVVALGVDPPRGAGALELRGEGVCGGVVTRGAAEVALFDPASVGEAARGAGAGAGDRVPVGPVGVEDVVRVVGVGACDAPELEAAGAGGRISTGRVTVAVGEMAADAVGEVDRVAPVVDDAVVAVPGEAERELGPVAGGCAAVRAVVGAGEDAGLEPLPPGVAGGRVAVAVGDASFVFADELGDCEGSG